MPADPSIYSLLKPQERLPGPLEQYGQMMSIKQLMDSSQLNELQRRKLTTDIDEEERFKNALGALPPGAMTAPDTWQRLMGISPSRAFAAQKSVTEQQKAEAEFGHKKVETLGKSLQIHRDELTSVNDPEAAKRWIMAGFNDPVLSPTMQRAGSPEQWIAKIPQDPQGFQQWKMQNGLGIEKYQASIAPKVEYVDAGGKKVPVQTNPLATGGLGPVAGAPGIEKTATPGEIMSDKRQRELNGILEGQTSEPSPDLVKGIASGEIELKPPPTNARNPIMLDRYGKILAKVKETNPNWSQDMYPTIKKTVAAFAAGPEAKTMKALNTATDHLETLRELGEAMKNGNIGVFNKLSNQWATATGGAAPGNLQVAAQVIGGEIVKSIVGAGGGVGERERAEAAFSNVKSPEQLAGAIDTVTKLMGGQFKGMKQQYEAGTYGRQDFDKYLSPAAKKALDKAKPAEAPKPAAPTTFDSMPDPAKLNGKLIVDDSGTKYRSNGTRWVRE